MGWQNLLSTHIMILVIKHVTSGFWITAGFRTLTWVFRFFIDDPQTLNGLKYFDMILIYFAIAIISWRFIKDLKKLENNIDQSEKLFAY